MALLEAPELRVKITGLNTCKRQASMTYGSFMRFTIKINVITEILINIRLINLVQMLIK